MFHASHLSRLWLCGMCLSLPAFALAQQPAGKEYYQDFRGAKPLIDELKTFGADTAAVSQMEDGGMRFTLAAKREWKGPVGVQSHIPLSGDFEVTGTYEIIAIERPPVGTGWCRDQSANDQIIESRQAAVRHLKYGNVFRPGRSTAVAKGQSFASGKEANLKLEIRLKRSTMMHYSWVRTASSTNWCRASSTNAISASSGFLIRTTTAALTMPGSSISAFAPTCRQTPAAPIPAPPVGNDAEAHQEASGANWLIVILAIGAAGIVMMFALLGGLLLLRARRGAKPEIKTEPRPIATTTLAFPCSECGKKLKTKSDSAGKKIKCPHCGATQRVADHGGAAL